VDGTEAGVTIDNSSVTASSEGAAPGWNRGIGAYGNSYVTSSPSVTITNSDVVADGDPAITAYSRNPSLPGVVRIGMPATVTPAGAQGRAIDNGEFYGTAIAMAPVDSLSSSTKNSGGSHIEIKAAGNPQTVDENTFGGTETTPAEAVTQKAASAEPAKHELAGATEYEPAKHEPAKETAKAEPTAPTLPQTGDESAPAAGVIAAAAAGAIALASSLRLRLFQR
jgi:LPXTG-motif cell wall-anchored protein